MEKDHLQHAEEEEKLVEAGHGAAAMLAPLRQVVLQLARSVRVAVSLLLALQRAPRGARAVLAAAR